MAYSAKIKIVPADFEKAALALHRTGDLLNEYRAELSSKYSDMADEWRGLAGEAFSAGSREILDQYRSGICGLDRLTKDIEKAGKFMKVFDRMLAAEIADNSE